MKNTKSMEGEDSLHFLFNYKTIIMKLKNLIITLALICICIFMAPFYIDLFTGSDHLNANPFIYIGFGVLSVPLLFIYKNIHYKNLKK